MVASRIIIRLWVGIGHRSRHGCWLWFRVIRLKSSAQTLAVYPVAVGVLLTVHLLGVLRIEASAETLAIYPIAIRVLLTTDPLLIIGIEASTETLAIHPIA